MTRADSLYPPNATTFERDLFDAARNYSAQLLDAPANPDALADAFDLLRNAAYSYAEEQFCAGLVKTVRKVTRG